MIHSEALMVYTGDMGNTFGSNGLSRFASIVTFAN